MIRQAIIVVLLILVSFAINGQKVIDSITNESCHCFEKFLETSKLPVDDSLTNCITLAIIPHCAGLGHVKKLNPGTVEGIRAIHIRVRKSLKKKCSVFTGKE